MAQVFYNYISDFTGGTIVHLINEDIKLLLVDETYVFDPTTQYNLDDIAEEVTGTGYTTGGKSLSNKSVTGYPDEGLSVYYADDVVWTSSSIRAYGAIMYQNTGTPATSKLIAYFDFGGPKVTTNEAFSVRWGEEGILKFQ